MKQIAAAIALFLAGAAVGALFYPSKRVAEKEHVISQLREEKARAEASVRELDARTEESTVIVERPDGSKRIRIEKKREKTESQTHSETATAKVDQKVDSEKEKVTETNRRRFSIEVGIRTDLAYYLRADADLVGPIFLGVQGDSRGVFGAGIGLRF